MNEHVDPVLAGPLNHWFNQQQMTQREQRLHRTLFDYLARKGHHRVDAEAQAREMMELLTNTLLVLNDERERLEEAKEKTQ